MEKIINREQFRQWLRLNHKTAKECWLKVKRGKPNGDNNTFWYLDAVEEALCFGWIDCTVRNGMQRFVRRRPGSHWTELNKARCRRLIDMGLMTDAGLESYLSAPEFHMDADIEKKLRDAGAWERFNEFPELYRKIRISNAVFYRKLNEDNYRNMVERLISESKKGNMYGQWNDWGRLI